MPLIATDMPPQGEGSDRHTWLEADMKALRLESWKSEPVLGAVPGLELGEPVAVAGAWGLRHVPTPPGRSGDLL